VTRITVTLWAAFACLFPAIGTPAPPDVLSPAGILVDAQTGTVLWAHNPDERRPIASTTKIMTALLVLESGRLDETIQVSPAASKVEESSLNLKPGEHMTLNDLLHGIIMRSANDACVAAAEHVDGSVVAFVNRMNARATELGCGNTRYRNPNGLHENGHYSSARDLAIIARAAMQFPMFRDIVRTPDYTIERDKNKYDRALKARDYWFLTHFPGADGIKTGYTRQAGHCFVGSATRDGLQLISVLLHSPNIKKETCTLLDWGFRNFRGCLAVQRGSELGRVGVEGGAQGSVAVQAMAPVFVVLPKMAEPVRIVIEGRRVVAPVKVGQSVGTVRVVSNGRVIREVDAVAMNAVDISFFRKARRAALVVLLLGLGGWIVGATAKTNRRRRRRIAARRRGSDSRRSRVPEREDGVTR
jgi:serine-type D-Ala-D-Ala carboxypeptidase (penicillin-binding protein 5/6)